MKPLRLHLQAFGPYAKSNTIDFRMLLNGGIFLIHGQTGAGKTSILDGICFALFGTASGDDRRGEGMRCDLAPPELPTETTLDFTLGRRVFRVYRRPRQELRKLRGTGLKTFEPTAELLELPNASDIPEFEVKAIDLDQLDWTLLAAGSDKVNKAIRDLLGMDEKQFRQVVVLPQGQFRQFLASSSTEREKILETLFRTQDYRLLSDRLKEKASRVEKELKEKQKLLEGQLASRDSDSLASLQTQLLDLEEKQTAFASSEKEIHLRLVSAIKDLDLALAFDRLSKEKLTAETEQKILEAQSNRILSFVQKLKDNERALPVLNVGVRVEKTSTELEKLSKQKSSTASDILKYKNTLGQLKTLLEPLLTQEPEIAKARSERDLLREYHKSAQRLEEQSKGLQSSEAQVRKFSQEVDSLETNLSLLRQKQITLQENLTTLGATSDQLAQAQLEHERTLRDLEKSKSCLQEASELRKRESSLSRMSEERGALGDKVGTYRTSLSHLKVAYHLSQAAILAQTLKAEHPCPVCGSHEHPHPAQLPASAPTTQDLEEKELELSQLETRLTQLSSRIQAEEEDLNRRLANLREIFPNQEDVFHAVEVNNQETQKRIAVLLTNIQLAQQSEQRAATIKVVLKETEITLKGEEQKRETLIEDLNRCTLQHQSLLTAINEIHRTLPEDLRSTKVIVEHGTALSELIKSYEQERERLDREIMDATKNLTSCEAILKTLNQQIDDKNHDLLDLQSELSKALVQAGFASIEMCKQVQLSPEISTGYELEVKNHDQALAVINARLTQLAQETEDMPASKVDLETARRVYENVDQERLRWENESGELKAKIEALRPAIQKVQALESELKALEDKYRILGRLGSAADGHSSHNSTRVSFQRYVLGFYLDAVLSHASRRLFIMSRGQFILRRMLKQEDGRTSAGLDLEVEDNYTGTCRPTAYLSGGEGFLASLALALGLADVVQSDLGGVHLDAVFVDEGFGTLDPESLELALRTLADLQAGGRIVGIISHVPELRQQIPQRLFISRTPEGSTAIWENHSSSFAFID